MALPIVLYPSEIAVLMGGSSPNNITVANAGQGEVTDVYSGSTHTDVGDFVAFRIENARDLSYNGNSYMIVPETDILLKEIPPL